VTNVPKSDSQLDAEAVEPTEAQKAALLRWYIVDLRRAFHYETPSRLHQQSTSAMGGDEVDERGWPKDADEGGIGPPFSSMWHRFLRTNAGPSAKHQWDTGPNPRVRPAMASVQNESERCHARHVTHRRPGYTRGLCAELMFQAGYLGQEPDDLAWHFDLSLEGVSALLLDALKHARLWRVGTEIRLTREPGHVAPLPERKRVA
jgi:hypothetical protein